MQQKDGRLTFSASDLANHNACRHLSSLELDYALSGKKRPYRNDAFLETLRERGKKFEKRFLEALQKAKKKVVEIDPEDPKAAEKTLTAMKDGADYIYQAKLAN